MAEGEVTAAMLIIGNEILSGRTQDANLDYVALGLNEVGVQTQGGARGGRRRDAIIEAVNALRTVTTMSSPPAASGRPMTTSPPNASPRPSASICCAIRARSSGC